MRGELAELIDQGKSHDEIIQAFVTMYGSEEMLGAPIDKGFNRLAWLFPYLVGATGAFAVGFVAVRWSRHHQIETPETKPSDPDLEERLDDELRNLD
jgi:cytochrome c-type biogenesis protein CcmH/NrfF